MITNENEKESEKSNIINNNSKNEKAQSSLKNIKLKGLTSEQIIKKYENVLFTREKQFYELSNEITKLTQIIQNLVEKKNKSKYNNDKLKEILENNEKILKQELSNKEIGFMKLTDLEHKYDDLQNKIDDIINKQNALAESKERNENEENIKLIDKNNHIIEDKKNIKENIIIKEEKKNEENNTTKKEKKNEENKIINEEIKVVKKEEKSDKNNIENKDNIEQKIEIKEKKETKVISARERLNKLKEKKEKLQKLNFSDIISQTNINNA